MFSYAKQTLKAIDPDVWAIVQQEHRRQEQHIELIAGENYASPAVMAAQGSQLTNKQAQGYPGRRDDGGCEYVDLAEQVALDRVKRLFGADRHGWAANVQPHSGAQANAAVFMALMQPGDTLMSMSMSLSGGDTLRHGMPVNMSGQGLKVVSYGLNAQEEIDYEGMARLAQEARPKLIVAGSAAYSLRIDYERCARAARDVGALLMVDMAHVAGLIAAGEYPHPIPHADVVTSSTHKSLRGPRGGFILMRPEHEKAINSAVFPGLQADPLMHVIAAKSVAFKEALEPDFKAYQRQAILNAAALAETLVVRGLRIVGGRTESHQMLVDLRSKGLTGQEAEALLGQARITVNQSAIPHDLQPPQITSGVRLGVGAMTTRGFKELEARKVGHLIANLLERPRDDLKLAEVRAQVALLTRDFPIYA